MSVGIASTPEPVKLGGNLTYTVKVTNSGPATVQPIVTHQLPNGGTFVSATPSQGAATPANGFVFTALGPLGPGQIAAVTVVVTPTAPGQIYSSVSVSGVAGDPKPENDSATALSTAVALPSMSIDNVALLEGNSGSKTALFTVALSAPFTETVSVDFSSRRHSNRGLRLQREIGQPELRRRDDHPHDYHNG